VYQVDPLVCPRCVTGRSKSVVLAASEAQSPVAPADRKDYRLVNRCQGAHGTRPAIFRCATMSLLSKKRALRDELAVTANKIGDESRHKPKKIDHVSRLTPSARGWHC
jgi:hypothetical protein